jgi:prefoldin subunit 5
MYTFTFETVVLPEDESLTTDIEEVEVSASNFDIALEKLSKVTETKHNKKCLITVRSFTFKKQ